ncbi:hypothetical protein O9992_24840 [Vibrio lentus]|nr:hypothetical protein [Vibrio lentus]
MRYLLKKMLVHAMVKKLGAIVEGMRGYLQPAPTAQDRTQLHMPAKIRKVHKCSHDGKH